MSHEIKEHAGSMLGVSGRFNNAHARNAELWDTQTWTSEARAVEGYGCKAHMSVSVRFDDNCKNGSNSFAIVANVRTSDRRYARDGFLAGGCMHDEIAVVFPELAPLIRWHLSDSHAPMHYFANALYLAGDRDYNGRACGDVERFDYGLRFNGCPLTHRVEKSFYLFLRERIGTGEFILQKTEHKKRADDSYDFAPHYTFVGFNDEDWARSPFKDETAAREFSDAITQCKIEFVEIPVAWSKGKERELDAARCAANWPEATDAQLTLPREELKVLLEARLSSLQSAMCDAIRAAGLAWTPAEVKGDN